MDSHICVLSAVTDSLAKQGAEHPQKISRDRQAA